MLDISVRQLKYAVEIARCGSISKAARMLFVNQSSISKAVKELEKALGYDVFQRNSGGVTLTEEGKTFLQCAEEILLKLDTLERQAALRQEKLACLNISVPRATYITHAFTSFFRSIQDMEQIRVNYKETNSQDAVEQILHNGFHLGIIRYPLPMDAEYKARLSQNHLSFREVWTFDYLLLLSENSPLAQKAEVHPSDLHGMTELIHGDISDPFIPQTADAGKCIFLYERGSQFDFLQSVPSTYMWVSPLPEELLKRHHLVQKPCSGNRYCYKDVLVFKEDHRLSAYAERFYATLLQTRDEITAALSNPENLMP